MGMLDFILKDLTLGSIIGNIVAAILIGFFAYSGKYISKLISWFDSRIDEKAQELSHNEYELQKDTLEMASLRSWAVTLAIVAYIELFSLLIMYNLSPLGSNESLYSMIQGNFYVITAFSSILFFQYVYKKEIVYRALGLKSKELLINLKNISLSIL